jgi:hypothetical protein
MKKKLKVSFDFECLSDNSFIQTLFDLLNITGHDVFILTSRSPESSNKDIYKFAKDHKISESRIFMTDGFPKVHTFMAEGFDLHFDTSFDEVVSINDMFQDSKKQSLPAILVNFGLDEMGDIYNFVGELNL